MWERIAVATPFTIRFCKTITYSNVFDSKSSISNDQRLYLILEKYLNRFSVIKYISTYRPRSHELLLIFCSLHSLG